QIGQVFMGISSLVHDKVKHTREMAHCKPVKKQGKPESGLRKLSAFSCQFPLLNPAGRDRTKNAGRGDLWHAQGAALGLVGEHLRTFLHQGVLVAVEIDEDGLRSEE